MPIIQSLRNGILDQVDVAGSGLGVALSGNLFIGLSTTTIAGDGTNITEPDTGDGYAREAVTLGAAASGQRANTGLVEFNAATASWGTISDCFIADAVTSGQIIAIGTLSTPRLIDTGDIGRFAIGAFVISLA